jgi:urease accessory protein
VEAIIEQNGWEAELDLAFTHRTDRTVLTRRKHRGPLIVQRPFYPEGQVCHVYIVHPPGGVVGGDRLTVNITNREHAQILLTTPAANKFYRSAGPVAQMRQTLTAETGSFLEWLPQETILYDGAAVDTATVIQLNEGSRFIGWEIVCLGRPASGESYTRGSFRQDFELWKAGRPLYLDRSRIAGGSESLQAAWGYQSYPVAATMIACPADIKVREAARDAMLCGSDRLLSTTLIDNVLVCRYLGHHAEQAKHGFRRIWEAVRPEVLQREACAPRIWST